LLGYFEALHDRLLRVVEQPANRAYVLGVTSCVPRSGVSTIAAGLAITLARNGEQRVLVVHHPRAACGPRLFWADAASGLVDAVADTAGNAAAVRNRAAEVSAREREAEPAGAGTVPARYSDLVHSLQQSSGRFVIVDLPPVTEISPTLRYAGLLDGVLLVVGSEEVDRDVARRAKQLLIEAGANVIGTVFNKHRQHVPTWLQPAG
jgi:Mrp family chromosome partitioning ATPase